MSRGRVLLVAITALCVVAVGAPSASAAASKCKRPKGAKVVVASRLAIVYSRVETSLSETSYWACLKSKGKRFRLTSGRDADASGVSVRNFLFRLRGKYVAYATDQTNAPSGTQFVAGRVFDVRNRRLRRMFTLAQPESASNGQFPYALRQLLVTTRGYVAWHDSGQATAGNGALQDRVGIVDLLDSRIVATAPPGAISGLSLKKNVAMWTQSGVARSFALQQLP